MYDVYPSDFIKEVCDILERDLCRTFSIPINLYGIGDFTGVSSIECRYEYCGTTCQISKNLKSYPTVGPPPEQGLYLVNRLTQELAMDIKDQLHRLLGSAWQMTTPHTFQTTRDEDPRLYSTLSHLAPVSEPVPPIKLKTNTNKKTLLL